MMVSALALLLTLSADPVIATRMQSFVDSGAASGIVTLVAKHGKITHLSAVGYLDREAKTPMRTDSIFQVMSLTKAITSAGIMILVDEGRVSLMDPIEKHLPEFKGVKLTRAPNIRDLLTHTSGMMGGMPAGFNGFDRTLAEAVSAIAKAPLQSEPGAAWHYSNAGMATLGRIIEVVSGEPYDRFIAGRIFKPLAMKDSTFYPGEEIYPRIASVYTDDHGTLKKADVNLYRKGSVYPSPQGGLYTTATDMWRFYQMLLNKGTLDSHRVLSAPAVELMTMNQTGDLKAGFVAGMGYGFGLSVVRAAEGMFRYNSMGAFGHGGAWRTYAWGDPAKELVGVLMYQRTNGGGDAADEQNAFMALAAQ